MFATGVFLLLSALSARACAHETIAKGYYPGWTTKFPLSEVSWSKYSHVTYAFAVTTSDGKLSLEGSNPDGLAPFVKAAREHGVTPCISIGGWTGSRFFSTAVGSPLNRTEFVTTILDFALKYDLQCIDLDWEYPAKQGIGCNTINKDDTANFLSFLQELRVNPAAATYEISAAVGINTFIDGAGNPSTDVSGFANVLDHIVLMNYDIYGSWSDVVGPNAPLNDTCAPAPYQQGSGVWSVDKWTKAGMPKEKLVLGVGSYGHAFTVKKEDAFVKGSTAELNAYPPFDKTHPPFGENGDDSGVDVCGVKNGPSDVWSFRAMVENGYLKKDGTPNVPHRFDECSKTAYVYNADKQVQISFDDAKAFEVKGTFIKDFGLRGYSVWEVTGDESDILLNAIRKGAGLDS
ncbi:hypothetical protein VNI00_004303 [Paramarasmius palmivorus]|uniref:GH18 domain-containing protein n=1 Tax=Paramarasmius palmivorus TaxID=297713 RepID=A0AAW0DMI5_9AGAR